MRLGIDAKIKQIVDRMAQVLLAAEIAFRRLHGCMAQQELDLLQLTTAAVVELGTSPAKVLSFRHGPRGWYPYSVLPFHAIVFRGMLNGIEQEALKIAASPQNLVSESST